MFSRIAGHFKLRFLRGPVDYDKHWAGASFYEPCYRHFDFHFCVQMWFLYQCTEPFPFSCFTRQHITYTLRSVSSQLWEFVPLISSFLQTSFSFCYFGASSLMSPNILKNKEGTEKPATLLLALLPTPHPAANTTLPGPPFISCSLLCSHSAESLFSGYRRPAHQIPGLTLGPRGDSGCLRPCQKAGSGDPMECMGFPHVKSK